MIKQKVLIIEDEASQLKLLKYNVEREGYIVFEASDGEAGFLKAIEELPDLILLDWMLPKISGLEVCRKLRRNKATEEIPIIFISARAEETDKIRGLEIGADDYIVKPYSIKEMLARCKVALRRPVSAFISDMLRAGPIAINTKNHEIFVKKEQVYLSLVEYRLLIEFVKRPNRVLSREYLLDSVWGVNSEVDYRSVDVNIGRLRKSLGAGLGKNVLKSVRGFGYLLSIDEFCPT